MEAMIVGLILQGGMTAVGEILAGMDEQEADRIMQGVYGRLNKIQDPELKQMIAEQLGPSQAGAVKSDPMLAQAQQDALGRFTDIADSGGFTLSDKAALNQISNRISRQEAGQRGAIMENAAARGVGGSGLELAASLQNQQGAANRMSQEGMDMAGMAQQRVLDAIMGKGEMAGRMRSQGFNENMQTAQARDMINQYNAGARERAQRYNLGLPQQQYENQMRRFGIEAGLDSTMAGRRDKSAMGQRKFWGTMGATMGQAGRAYGQGAGGGGQVPEMDDAYWRGEWDY